MADNVKDGGLKILVTLDTSQIYLKTQEAELQKELKKYKLKITPEVDFVQISQLETRMDKLQKTQLIQLKIDETAAIKSVENISTTITSAFNNSFSKNITKVISSSQTLETAFRGISGAAGSVESAMKNIDFLVSEKGNMRIDLFTKRVEKLVTTFSSLGSSDGKFADLQMFATNVSNIVGTIQSSFDREKITPKFDFSPGVVVGQFKQQKAAIENKFLTDAEAQIELNAIPKFKEAVDKDGKRALIKIPGTLDKDITFKNIAAGINSISAQLITHKISLKVPVDYQSIREDLSSIELNIKVSESSIVSIRDVHDELFAISELKFENLKAIKGVKLPSKNEGVMLESLKEVLATVNELKAGGIKLDEQAAQSAMKAANHIDAEAKAYEKKISAYKEAKKIFLNAYKNQLDYNGDTKSDNKKHIDENVKSAEINLQEKLLVLEKEEQESLLKNLEIEKEILKTKAQSKRDEQLKKEKDELDRISNSVRSLEQQYKRINATIHDKANTAHMKDSPLYEEYLTLVENFKSEYSKLNTPGISTNQAQIHLDNLTKTQQRISEINAEISRGATANQNAAKDADKLSRIHQELISYLNKYGSELKQNTELYKKFISLQNKIKHGAIGHVDAKAQLAALRQEARLAGLEVDNVWKKLRRTFEARGRGWFSNQGWMWIARSLRDIWTNVVEIDSAMTELRKVTSATEKEYTQFLQNAQDRAQSLGSTLKDVVSASADMARLGYNIEDASTLADTSLIYKNVGDDVESIDDASKSIISTMQGFNIEAKNSIQIVDKYNEVANNYASSAGDIGEMIKRSAAAMKVSGASLDEAIALGVTANEVVQDADTVGRNYVPSNIVIYCIAGSYNG